MHRPVIRGDTLSMRAVSEIALYLLLRLVSRGARIVDGEELALLLFFALYTGPGPGGRPVLLENPPLMPESMEFYIHLRGPVMDARVLAEGMDEVARGLIGKRGVTGVYWEEGEITATAELARYATQLEESLAAMIEEEFGHEFRRKLDDWVIADLARRNGSELAEMALEALHLETDGPPVKKAMVLGMELDNYIDVLKVLRKIQRDIAEGRLHPDYELDEILGHPTNLKQFRVSRHGRKL